MTKRIEECINLLGAFCGMRDIPELTRQALQIGYGITQADVMVLFGGSILCGGDVLATAMQNNAAKKYIIVGGAGHTTETLRVKMHEAYPSVQTSGLPEAKVFAAYLAHRYGLRADYLECDSTNCGNNITNLLALLKRHQLPHRSIIISQDATMQRRMDAGLRKYAPDTKIINYAVYVANVVHQNSKLAYAKDTCGMWEIERYVTLLMGEIQRLSDDGDGYGPNGKNYIAHVDIPSEVRAAFEVICQEYGGRVREANPIYA